MKPAPSIYRTFPRLDTERPSAVTIGNFDGVHLGHQAILTRLHDVSQKRDLASTVMTFEPHPRAYFARRGMRPEMIPTQISTLRDKVQALARHHIQQIVLINFDQKTADMAADDFIREFLVKGLNTRWLLVGDDFRYGHKRSGDIDLLRRAGRQYGFDVETISDVVDETGQRISSSELRTALAMGEQHHVRHLLGHNYRISGHIVHGQKIGRDIGFPTLNFRVPAHCAARSGVYAVRVHGLTAVPLNGVASLGVRPTVHEEGQLLLEVHVPDAQLDVYGKLACVEFLKFLRDETKFPDLPTMIAAIKHDVRCAQDYFAIHGL